MLQRILAGTFTMLSLVFLGMVSAQFLRETKVEAQNGEPSHIVTSHDKIPNFCRDAMVTSVKSGSWNDVTVWSAGRVPGASDIVRVEAGHTVIVNQDVSVSCLGIHGTVRVDTTADRVLKAANYLVYGDGAFEAGTESSPVPADRKVEIVVADKLLDTVDDGIGVFDPQQFGTAFLALGKVTMHGAVKAPTFVRLATEPKAGDTTLTLSEAVSGWRAGDRLILPDTRQLDWNERGNYAGPYVPQWEELTLTGVSSDGTVLTLAGPLQFDHRGARDGDGVLRYLPHVGNLTRNVTVRSENPAGTRGHTFFTHRADVDVRYVTFKDLGRTKWDPALDNTTFDANGNVTYIGTNQIARYPIHTHHLMGPDPDNTPANGHQFTLIGNAVDGGSEAHKFRWGMTIHNSHYGLIRQNVVYNYGGCGVCTEDGSESFNVIERNFVARVWGNGDRLGGGRDGVGFWFRGPNNIVRDNVAASIVPTGYNYGFNVFAYNLGPVRVPLFRGADTSMEGQYRTVDMNATPLLEFARNETYGATTNGLALWWLGRHDSSPIGDAGVVKDFRVWHVFNYGYYGYDTNNLTMDGFTALGDPNRGELGIWFGDYWQSGVRITGANIQGSAVGIITPYAADGATIIEDSYLRNKVNIQVSAAWSSGNATQHPAKSAVIRNVQFAAPAGQPLKSIFMRYAPTGSAAGSNLIQKDELFVYDYNGVAGDNFQVYYKEQHPDFVVPETGSNVNLTNPLVGAPRGDIGLTNAQLVAKYPDGATIEGQFYQTVAIAGVIAPCLDDTTRPEVSGFTCPLDTPPPPRNPSLSITAPKNGETIVGATVTASTIGSAGDDAAVDHLHLQLDSDPEVRGLSLIGSHQFTNVPPGSHTIKGYLASADHSKVPGTEAGVSFATSASQPSGLSLKIKSTQRDRMKQEQGFSKVLVTVKNKGTGVVALQKSFVSSSDGTVLIPGSDLSQAPDDTTTVYAVSAKIHGHLGASVEKTNLHHQADPLLLPSASPADANGNGKAEIADVIALIRYRAKTEGDAQMKEIFLENPKHVTLSILVEVIRKIIQGAVDG